MSIEDIVWLNRNNALELQLQVNNKALEDHSLISRAILNFGSAIIDSDTSPVLFDLTQADRLVFKLGGSSLTEGEHHGRLITYDADNVNGVVWGTRIFVSVVSI